MAKFYVTTPIYYINDKPHIGHAYATLLADVVARYHRLKGDEVLFTTGTDENSQKTDQAAEKAGQKLDAYTEIMAKTWQDVWKDLGISNTKFIRTTSPEHHKAVAAFIKAVEAKGDLYRGTYEGLYCVGHEAFMRPDELVDGKCPDHGTKPEHVKEENYFFKLSAYQEALLDHIKKHPEFIQPVSRRNEVVAFIERGLTDFSVSRPHKPWGIPWPGAKDQVVYVWFDALINYLTATGYPDKGYDEWWPAQLHVVGKDITKFHCIYWPAMLLSAGLPLPQTVFAHGFFTVEGQKVSKSLGNAVDPRELVERYGLDALRYYLLREIPFGADGEFTSERFTQLYNTDLANELGNLVQRVAVMTERYLDGNIGDLPKHSHDITPYEEAMSQYRLDGALAEVWLLIKGLNQYLEEEQPWAKAKDDLDNVSEILHHAVTDLTQIAQLLLPFMPVSAQKILATFADGKVHQEVGLLFPKADTIEKTTFEVE